MPKNLLFIHLESVSQMAFWQYSPEMPALYSLMRRSTVFSNFFAASTSSVMSMGDLLFGDSSQMDHLESFPRDREQLSGTSSNLFRLLHDRDYAAYGVQYGSFCLGDAPNNFWGIWPAACGQFHSTRDREEMHAGVKSFLTEAKEKAQPFALYFWNMNTHLRDEDPLRTPNAPYHEKFREGYRLLDLSVQRLLDDIKSLGLLEDTFIVVFGDHGDDLFRHGIYKGRSHIIDPYANVCWCPLFIYNNDNDICITPQIMSMTDLKPTLLAMLFPGEPAEKSASAFSGVNILEKTRYTAFTQSMFALQRERSDPSRAITKSYAVTNGDFRLMASMPANPGDSGGLELFLEQWDYGDTRNLLDFCRLDANGTITSFGDPAAVHPHFVLTFTQKHVLHLVNSYEYLRKQLYDFIRLKEATALKQYKGTEQHLFPDEIFTRQRLFHQSSKGMT